MAAPGAAPAYRRVLLKISGEALAGGQGYGIDPDVISRIAEELAEVARLGVELAVVIGGGNIFRGIATIAAQAQTRDDARPHWRRRLPGCLRRPGGGAVPQAWPGGHDAAGGWRRLGSRPAGRIAADGDIAADQPVAGQ